MATESNDRPHIIGKASRKPDKSPEGEQSVRGYDFRRPRHLSAEQIRAIHGVHTGVAERIQASLERTLNVRIQAKLEKIEEVNRELLAESIPEYAYANVLSLSPIEDKGMILIESQICLAFVDRVLGGNGTYPAKARALTPIDEVAVEGVIGLLLRCVEEAWSGFCPIKPAVVERKTNARQASPMPTSEAALNSTFVISGDLGEGTVRLCLPVAGLKAALDGVSQRMLGMTVEPGRIAELRAAVVHSLGKASLPVKAMIGRGEAPIHSFVRLREGDVLRLDHPESAPVTVSVAGHSMFHAKLGLHGKKKAVQILERISQD